MTELRERLGWGAPFDGVGRVTAVDFAIARPGSFRKVGEIWHLVACCYSCRAEILLPLEGDDGETVWDPGMLSPAHVRLAQHLQCDPCADAARVAEEKSGKREVVAQRSKESRIPAGLLTDVSWESIIEKGSTPEETERRRAAIEACRVWSKVKRPKAGVWVYGPTGSGKTRLAATAAAARLEHSGVTWVPVALLMAQLQAGWDDEDRKRALRVLTGKGALVLDDLDKLNERSPAVMSQLFAAIDARDQAGATLLVTSNKKPSELAGALGDALLSRLLGMCVPRPYPGVDRRLELS